MLSNIDIEHELNAWKSNPENEGLNIVDCDKDSITPVGYDLRIGDKGFSWKNKREIDIKKDGKIKIEPNDTVIIYTFESINLSEKISGTIHSMVRRVVINGLSHISTTVDPGWEGKLLIAIHNHRETPIVLNHQARFCTICFYKMNKDAKDNRRTESNREYLWEELTQEASREEEKLEQQKKRIFLIDGAFAVMILVIGIKISLGFSDQATSIATVLAIPYPILRGYFLEFFIKRK